MSDYQLTEISAAAITPLRNSLNTAHTALVTSFSTIRQVLNDYDVTVSLPLAYMESLSVLSVDINDVMTKLSRDIEALDHISPVDDDEDDDHYAEHEGCNHEPAF